MNDDKIDHSLRRKVWIGIAIYCAGSAAAVILILTGKWEIISKLTGVM